MNNNRKENINHELSKKEDELNQNYGNKRSSKSYQIFPDTGEDKDKKKSEKLIAEESSNSTTDPRLYPISPSNTQCQIVPKYQKEINVTDDKIPYVVKLTESSELSTSQKPQIGLPSNCTSKESPILQNSIKHKNITVSNNEQVTKVLITRLAIFKLWVILFLTTLFCILLMTASHLTSSLTVRIEAYHALYNALALGGFLLTAKICQKPQSLKNTFGWARLEVLSCLCTLLFIASLCFSVTLESIQIVVHALHHQLTMDLNQTEAILPFEETMHHPLPIVALCGVGLCFNAFVFYLIGGFTHHQGCFLERRGSDAWVKKTVPQEAGQKGMRVFQEIAKSSMPQLYHGLKEIFRDVAGLALTMLCAAIVYLEEDDEITIYIDPLFAILSASILLFLSYPYGKECCQILLQTTPKNINVETFSTKLLKEFPALIDIHHLHIWSLSPGKVIATAHVVYSDPTEYRKSYHDLEQFFYQKDITQVTLQPEFLHSSHNNINGNKNIGCLLRCSANLCQEKECCLWNSETDESDSSTVQHILKTKASENGSFFCQNHHGTSDFRTDGNDIPQ